MEHQKKSNIRSDLSTDYKKKLDEKIQENTFSIIFKFQTDGQEKYFIEQKIYKDECNAIVFTYKNAYNNHINLEENPRIIPTQAKNIAKLSQNKNIIKIMVIGNNTNRPGFCTTWLTPDFLTQLMKQMNFSNKVLIVENTTCHGFEQGVKKTPILSDTGEIQFYNEEAVSLSNSILNLISEKDEKLIPKEIFLGKVNEKESEQPKINNYIKITKEEIMKKKQGQIDNKTILNKEPTKLDVIEKNSFVKKDDQTENEVKYRKEILDGMSLGLADGIIEQINNTVDEQKKRQEVQNNKVKEEEEKSKVANNTNRKNNNKNKKHHRIQNKTTYRINNKYGNKKKIKEEKSKKNVKKEDYYYIVLKQKTNSKKNSINKRPNWNKYTAKRHNNTNAIVYYGKEGKTRDLFF